MDSSLIIIGSEDEDSECEDVTGQQSLDDLSVLIVEVDEKKSRVPDHTLSPSKLDEDLVITFSRKAEVLPHARYDCTMHPFTPTEHEVGAPLGSNQLICDQCFCFICDKLASMCKVWCVRGLCHCNSHKKSQYWTRIRDNKLLGHLKDFNLQLSDLDSYLRHADSLLNTFKLQLAELYSNYLKGEDAELYSNYLKGEDAEPSRTRAVPHSQRLIIYDYSPVYKCLSSFLDEADRQEDKAAAVMRLGAAHDFLLHYHAPESAINKRPEADVFQAKPMLLQRVLDSVQRQMVMANFSSEFIYKLTAYYQRLSFPPPMRNLKNSLSVRPWDDLLLVSVLRGQNVSGIRKEKGKKDFLVESTAVVLLRSELLQQYHRYLELYRYIKVVQTDVSQRVQELIDLVPLFMCMAGQSQEAVPTFFPARPGPASRLRPHLFCLYLRVFSTGTVPAVISGLPAQPIPAEAEWQHRKGVVPLSRPELVKFAIRLLKASPDVYDDCQCWARLLELVNTPSDPLVPLVEPSAAFILDVRKVSRLTLASQQGPCKLPQALTNDKEFRDQALLLFVTEALAQRILQSPLRPALAVICAFKENMWCFRYLCDCLTASPDLYHYFLQGVQVELENAGGSSEIIKKMLQPTFGFLGTEKQIWMVGCSDMKNRASVLFGPSFGLPASVLWYGKQCAGWRDLLPCLYTEDSTPDVLLIHLGTNDLGQMGALELVDQMQRDLVKLRREFPAMRLVYSCIPESHDIRGLHPAKISQARKLVNNVMRAFVRDLGGDSIDHLDIKHGDQFLPDGVSLTPCGVDIVLNGLHIGLKRICQQR